MTNWSFDYFKKEIFNKNYEQNHLAKHRKNERLK